MSQSLSKATRLSIIALKKGISLREISRILCVSYGSVRQICAHYDEFGLEGIDTQYQHCG
jgi:transposase